MPVFQRFTELPPKDLTLERPILDLKMQVSPKHHFELAKDVAAFANHLGGCLLVGATEVDGHVGEYAGIPVAFADEVRAAYSLAVAQRCSPKPVIDFQIFDATRNGCVVLAVFVEPYLGGPIGVEVKGGEKPGAYTFPLRSGADAVYLLPEQLPMFSEPKLRRTFLMLSAIPIGGWIRVSSIVHAGQTPVTFFGTLREISLENNVVLFGGAPPTGVGQAARPKTEPHLIALDQIRSVYKATPDDAQTAQWNILTEPFV